MDGLGDKIRTLLSVLTQVCHAEAAQLIQDADGDVEQAISMYFASAPALSAVAAAGPSTSQPQDLKVAQIQAVLGQQLAVEECLALLRCAGGSVQRAIDHFLASEGEDSEGQCGLVGLFASLLELAEFVAI